MCSQTKSLKAEYHKDSLQKGQKMNKKHTEKDKLDQLKQKKSIKQESQVILWGWATQRIKSLNL